MKKILSYIIVAFVFYFGSAVPVLAYTDAERDIFYNIFLASYLAAAKKQISTFDLTEQEKNDAYGYVQATATKQNLIDSTWSCVQNVTPGDQMGLNNCFKSWADEQGKNLTNYINTITYY